MARPRKFVSGAERQRAYRGRRLAGTPEPVVADYEQSLTHADFAAVAAGLMAEAGSVTAVVVDREQLIRDHWGYSRSETRSGAERKAVAARILAKQDPAVLVLARELWAGQAGGMRAALRGKPGAGLPDLRPSERKGG